MEVVCYAIITAIWWMTSSTILLPFLFLLKFCKFFSDRWFSFFFMLLVKYYCGPLMAPLRKKAFNFLKDSLSKRDASKSLKVLEIGIGSGANFEFYPENSHLTALDMNVSFNEKFRLNQKKYPEIVYERNVVAFAEDMKGVEDSSMDVVISTYVLCSVLRMKDVMKEIKRVLKPGGKFLFLEHVAFPRSHWGYFIQKFADPLWNVYFGGCNITRNIADDIKGAGFSHVTCERLYPDSLWLFIRPQIYGIATK